MTGQDCDIANVKSIIAGHQSMSVFKDTKILAGQVAKMVDQVLKGQAVDINDANNYDNYARIVPTYLIVSRFVDADNYRQLLIDGGYYTEAELR
jgi:putative multiple sugar transport system substrate-binding protein